MEDEKKGRKRIYRKLRNKYRLVIMNDQTFEEKTSFRLSPLNVFILLGCIIISLVTFTIYIIAFTPLREYIPGYTDTDMRRKLVRLTLQSDSMTHVLRAQEAYFINLRNIIDGKPMMETASVKDSTSARFDTIHNLVRSKEDSLLRLEMESKDRFDLELNAAKTSSSSIGSFYFFTPLKGTITSEFDSKKKHFGIDIVSGPDEVIKSTLDGTVVLADWTSETGYVIGVQHSNNLLSMYKHNSALLKSVGDYVKSGEVIAIIGNSGEYTTGPHLHFELWYNGSAVNPADYISF